MLYPEVERQHFKLWLTSTAILEKIINNGLFNQTQILIEKIQKTAALYVQNSSFYDALDLLKAHKYCIISGNPGIGKTFLAQILLLQYISKGYQPVVIRSNISEAFDMLKASTKQVFYYDDFLGQTGWEEKLEKNEEQSILDFVKYVKDSKHAAFILTTREYILQRARNVYEKLSTPEFEYAKCIVKLDSYTRRDKAHILFNHIYFSKLTPEYKKKLCTKETLLKIVDHQNYSPRIVEWMSNENNLKQHNSTEYPKYFLDTLANPSELWRHAFRNHLSPSSRSLLLVLMTFRYGVELNDLQEAFNSYRTREITLWGGGIGPDDFMTALDELEGSFVQCERENERICITFHNPSVLDFLEKYLSENAETLYLLCSSIVFYDQFIALCSLRGGKKEHDHISELLNKNTDLLITKILECVVKTSKQKKFHNIDHNKVVYITSVQTSVEENIANAVRISSHLPVEHQENVVSRLLEIEISRFSTGKGDLEKVNAILKDTKPIKNIKLIHEELVRAIATNIESGIHDYEEFSELNPICEFIKIEPEALSSQFVETVGELVQQDAEAIFDWVISQADDSFDIIVLRANVESFETVFNIELSDVYQMIEAQEEELNERFDDSTDDWSEPIEDSLPEATDCEIISMFGSLHD